MSTATTDSLEQAREDVTRYGGSLDTMIFADYVDEDGKTATRPFQWSRLESRIEFTRFMGWCIKHKRNVRITPFTLVGDDSAA